jgi:uncharacterized protein YbjT (DUF2867 family)
MNVLLTGATGYIGRQLKEKLLDDPSVRLRLFVRNARKVRDSSKARAEIFEGNTLERGSIQKALQGIDTTYYLIHSMGAKGSFERLDRQSAENFRDACIEAKVKKIIYLGGLGKKDTASKHLLSRIETGEILSAKPGQIQTVWFRAGIIIGSGSASFEIIRNLVQKLPLTITPRWVHTKTQPISFSDVLNYLFHAKNLQTKKNLVVDIGSEPMSFKDMLLRASKVMGLKRYLIPVPVLTPRLSSYWLVLMTPVHFRIARPLVEGLKSETVMENHNAEKYFPHIRPISFEQAIKKALSEIEQNQVISRWCDSTAQKECDIKGKDRIESAVFRERIPVDFGGIPPEKVFDAVQSIGGENGWFRYDWLWALRGFVDKVLGGPGLSRGRRDPNNLRIGDSLDFWKVVDLKANKRLLLVNQMIVPGKAWLEFSIAEQTLVQTAHFLPKGLWGRFYWYITQPLHKLIFPSMAKGIIKKARTLYNSQL